MVMGFFRAPLVEKIRRISVLWRFEREAYQVEMRVRQPVVLISFGAALLWYFLEPTSVSVMSVVMLGGLVAASYSWLRVVAGKAVCRRELLYTALQVGDELEEQITLENPSGLPLLWAEFEDYSNFPDYKLSVVNAVNAGSRYRWRVSARCSLRGVFSLGPWKIYLGDPFGIFRACQIYSQTTEVLVYPPLASLPQDLMPRSRQMGDLRALNQPLAAETISAATTRPFLPGDPLRHIHWRTSARRGELYARVFQPEASTAIWILPDMHAAVQAGEGSDSTLETLVILAATLASQLLEERFAVGMLGETEEAQAVLPQHGKAHLWPILRSLALLESTPTSLAELMMKVRPLVSERDTLLILTPSLQVEWVKSLTQFTQGRYENNVEAILLDPESYGGPGGVEAFRGILTRSGVAARILRRGDVLPQLETYGKVRRWEFMTLGTGRVIALQTPRQRGTASGLQRNIRR